jgi:glycosyltransferase involved in cell wall biosynthesis
VLSQRGVEVEVLLVDDCSDGPTREFIETLAATDDRIRTFFLQRNGGQAQARNIGAALARGRFVAFLDQDDEHEAGWYAHAVKLMLDHPVLGAVSGRATVIDLPERLGITGPDLRVTGLSYVFITNMVFRTSVFRASGGFPTEQLWRSKAAGEDGVFRMGFAQNWTAHQCDHPAVVHRAREGGATVFFLDRSVVQDGKVVMTRLEEIERNGQLPAAHAAHLQLAQRTAAEMRACTQLSPPAS